MIAGDHNLSAGFTLVEVLASLALVGIILPAAMAGVSMAMRMEETARRRTEAAVLASSKLGELVATGDWQGSETSGLFGEDAPGYAWELTVDGWDEPGLSQVTVTVERQAGGNKSACSVTTLAYVGEQ